MSVCGCASRPIIVDVRGLAWISLAVILSLHIRDFRALWGECGVSLIQAEADFPPPNSLWVLMPMAAYHGQAWKTEYCWLRRMGWRIFSVCFQTILQQRYREPTDGWRARLWRQFWQDSNGEMFYLPLWEKYFLQRLLVHVLQNKVFQSFAKFHV